LKLRWIDTLNDQTTWTSPQEVTAWLFELTGQQLSLSPAEMSIFFEELDFIREQISNLHFGEPLALGLLDEKLQRISPTINMQPHDQRIGLPLLMASRASNSDQDILRSVCDTLLLQFASFLSDALDSESTAKIVRCEGLFRERRKERKRLGALPAERESAWRAEISLIQESEAQVADEIQRCEDLFVLSSKAKFCSDSCRFATFQISKQLKDPGYMKEKQRRYRSRKETQ